MNKSNKLLSDIVAFRTYAKYLPHLNRRESLEETINRKMVMDLDKFGSLSKSLSKDIIKAYGMVHDLKIMPSMRGLQFAGDAVLKNNVRQYNCSALPINDVRSFGETLYLLLSGVGVGFSVQRSHINSLPKIKKPKEEGIFLVHDSIEGWCQAVDTLMDAYFFGRIRPVFDFKAIRPKGSYLVTTGAKAPGPEPLKFMLEKVEEILIRNIDKKLISITVHDIICLISDSVLAGGIRRAALISLFDRDDEDMLKSKTGEWWIKHPYRARANNSAVLPREEVTKKEFMYIYNICRESGGGEPGFSWTSNTNMLFNPCHEISLQSNQFCNLVTINQTNIKNEKDLMNRIYYATLLATLQASYTDFNYLRDIWKETTEKESLIGVSFTGIADNNNTINAKMLQHAAKLVLDTNEKYAKKLGINLAARATTLKPEGSSSCVLSSSSGIHARHADYYLRRIRMNKDDALAVYLSNVIPDLVEEDKFSSNGVVVTIPQESPSNAMTREKESAISLFNRAMLYNRNWVKFGHRSGDNRNNVSCTISVKEEEWDELAEHMWNQRDLYSGISLLPYDGGKYEQTPFEDCDKDTFNQYMDLVENVDLKNVIEEQDNTNRAEQIACGGGKCEIV